VSANAEAVATAIATYLVEYGAHQIADQIMAIRLICAEPWREVLLEEGFDDAASMTLSDIADGVDVALDRLVDAAQEVYDLCGISNLPYDACDVLHEGDCAWKCGVCGNNWAQCQCGDTSPVTAMLKRKQRQPAGGQ